MLRNVMLYLFLETILKNLPGEFDALEYSSTRDRGKRKIKFYDEVHVNHIITLMVIFPFSDWLKQPLGETLKRYVYLG